MVDDTNYEGVDYMKKFTFTVEVVGQDVDTDTVRNTIANSVQSFGDYRAVSFDEVQPLAEQGLKVWAKRRAGISLAAPKAVKAPKVVKTEVAAS